MKHLTYNLKQWLLENSLSTSDAAKLFKVNRTYISLITTGKRRPSPELARRIALITGISLEDLLFPEEGGASATETPGRVHEQNTIKTAARQHE